MKKKDMLRFFSIIMVVTLVISYTLPINNVIAESSVGSNHSMKISNMDTKGHWAEGQINKWLERKIIQGYVDHTFRPNQEVTRAEFLTIINRVLGLKGGAITSFSDVANDAWYAEDVAKGSSEGMIYGYADHTFRPNNNMTRQDAAVVLARAFHLVSKNNASVVFEDEDLIETYAKSAVHALAEQAYLVGYQDQSFGPDRFITRAETVAVVDRLVAEIYQNSGTFDIATIKGNVVVNTDKVILKNTIIEGNLYLTAGIAQGDSTLDHVTVKGETVITGGGSHSIHIHDSVLGQVIVDKQDNDIRVEVTGTTTIENVSLQSSVRLEGNTTGSGGIKNVSIPENANSTTVTLSGNFENVQAGSSNASLNIEDGNVKKLTLSAKSKLIVGQNAVVNQMTISETAAGSNIQVKGTIKELDIQAADTEINGKKAEKGSGFEVKGEGDIKRKPTATPTSTIAPTIAPTSAPVQSVPQSTTIRVTSINVTSAGSLTTVSSGSTLQMGTSILPANANNKAVTWSITPGTGNATISGTGLLTAIGIGTVSVKATAQDGSGIMGTKVITVTGIPITSISVTGAGNATTVSSGGTLQMSATILPNNASNHAVIWIVTPGTGNATISGTGLLTATGIGTVSVKAKAQDGSGIESIEQVITVNAPPPLWTLSWSDEFNGSTIDTDKWAFDIGKGANGDGWGNNEIQYYTNNERNVKLENGSLVITAVKDDVNTVEGAVYTSSRLVTRGNYAQKYGKIEVKAKTPEGAGFWPAIWMMPENNKYGTWAASGEIDIMENQGRVPNTVSGTLHYGEQYPGNTYTGKAYNLPNNGTVADYHVYTLEWEPGEFRWYVDGELYQTQNDWYSKSLNQKVNNTYPAPFDQPFHLLLNLALGGNFDGNIVPNVNLYPAKMEVDYVRMYELTGRPYREPVPPVLVKDNLPNDAKPALPNGNLVYNVNFDQDDGAIPNLVNPDTSAVANTDYWSLFTGAGGNGTVSIDAIEGSNYAKAVISAAGSQSYSVQLLNTISIAKGRYYKISFDAKSTVNRSIIARVTGGASRGFAAYSQSLTAALNDQVQHYEMSFQMKQDTDIIARTEFNLGLDNHTVWIGNVRVEEIDGITTDFDAKKVPLNGSGNRIYNGTFDQGDQTRLNYWHVTTANAAVATPSVSEEERYLNLAITNIGSGAKGDIKLLQKGVYLINNQTYEVTFDASSTTETSIDVELLSKDGLTSYAKGTLTLDSSTSLRTVALGAMSAATDQEAQLVFHLGGTLTTIHMDNIKLKQTSIYIDPSVNLFPLVNGGFTGTILPWERINVDGTATASLVDGAAKITVAPYTGTFAYGMMLIQNGLSMKNDLTYTVEFDARSTVDRQIEFILENAGFTRFFDKTVSLTNTMNRYSFEFTMSADDTLAAKFLLGKVGSTAISTDHDIFIDNVTVEVKGAKQFANILTNGTVDTNANGWGSYFNGTGSAAMVQGELKASLTSTGGANWASQIFQNGLTLASGKSYMLSFDARSSIGRIIEAAVEHNGDPYTKYLDENISLLSDGMHSYSLFFTMPTTDAGAHVIFLLGQIGSNIVGPHDVFLDNISLVEVSMPAITPAEGHALANGTFDTNADGWALYKNDGSDAAVSAVAGQMEVNFPNYDGWEKWSTQVFQDHLKLEAGKTYAFSFDASSSVGKGIGVEILTSGGGHHLTQQNVTLSTYGQTFTYEFTVSVTDQNAKIAFLLGGSHIDGALFADNSKIHLDNITLVEAGHALLNGTFTTNVDGWQTYKKDGSDAVASSAGGQMEVNFPNYDGWEKWSTQIFQDHLKLDAGQIYTLTFDASSTVNKDIGVEILAGGGGHLLGLHNVSLTTNNQTVTYNFTVSATEQNAKIAFLLGGNHIDGTLFADNSKIHLDNISITGNQIP